MLKTSEREHSQTSDYIEPRHANSPECIAEFNQLESRQSPSCPEAEAVKKAREEKLPDAYRTLQALAALHHSDPKTPWPTKFVFLPQKLPRAQKDHSPIGKNRSSLEKKKSTTRNPLDSKKKHHSKKPANHRPKPPKEQKNTTPRSPKPESFIRCIRRSATNFFSYLKNSLFLLLRLIHITQIVDRLANLTPTEIKNYSKIFSNIISCVCYFSCIYLLSNQFIALFIGLAHLFKNRFYPKAQYNPQHSSKIKESNNSARLLPSTPEQETTVPLNIKPIPRYTLDNS